MQQDNIKIIKKINKIKKTTRDRNIRIKLELFILALKLDNVSEACSRRGFSRSFYYKWWKRFKRSKFKLKSLHEKSRKPKRSPNKTTKHFENKILDLNSMGYGSRMIQAKLKRDGKDIAQSTINHILNGRKKPCKRRAKALKAHRKRYELPIPGQRVQIDVKYVPKLLNGERMYCFNAIDESTRYKFARIYSTLSEATTEIFLSEMCEKMPFPIKEIQTDNGFEFTNRFHSNKGSWKHMVEHWCELNNVSHRLIPPGAKELNGKVERSHRIDEQYFYWRCSDKCLSTLNEQLDEWCRYYNNKRPHGGLSFLTPHEKLIERGASLETEKVDSELTFFKKLFLRDWKVFYLKVYKPIDYKKFKMAA